MAFGLLLLLLALLLFWQSGRQRRSAGIPAGRIVYSDTGRWEAAPEPFFDPITQLTGKPDYLVRQGRAVIPVEVKSSRPPEAPYDSHIYQLAAYCLLVERETGVRPPYGLIHYGLGQSARTFAVEYTPALEDGLLALLTEMRRADLQASLDRSHDQPGRCRGCGYLSLCEQRL
ncbi:MAG: Dna2/Cas4 domain-containing protein [Chloroflexi bacterium]|nr:Dna2/Cas4 domain-containing protein [Chloroflexota bacterium]